MRAQHVEYHAPARFDDELCVFVRVCRIGRTSVTWEFLAENVASRARLATARQSLVQVDLERHRPVEVAEHLRHAVTGFEREVET